MIATDRGFSACTMTALPARRRHDARLWTADQFLDFLRTRPDEERWQLVDGLAMMMVPPSFVHQRIVTNFEALLNAALKANRPDLFAYGNVGLRIPGVEDFHPQPDVVVCAAEADYVYYRERFSLVAEVLSPSNTAEMIERKLELYRSHPDNLYCLTIDQDSVHVALYGRESDWGRTDLRSFDDLLSLPAFGFQARLADLYEGTPLAR
jgi:Uma2 family endonuclease